MQGVSFVTCSSKMVVAGGSDGSGVEFFTEQF